MLALKFPCWEKKSRWWPESPATCFLSSFLSLLPHRNCPWSSKYPSTHLFTIHPSIHPSTHAPPTIRLPTHPLFIYPSVYLLNCPPFTHLPCHSTFPDFLPQARDVGKPGACLGSTHTGTGTEHRAPLLPLVPGQPSLNHRAGLPESTLQSIHF